MADLLTDLAQLERQALAVLEAPQSHPLLPVAQQALVRAAEQRGLWPREPGEVLELVRERIAELERQQQEAQRLALLELERERERYRRQRERERERRQARKVAG